MSQFCSRLHIMVKDVSDWEKARRIDSTYWKDAEDIFSLNSTSLLLDSDWSCDSDELYGLVYEAVKALGDSCIVIADSTNINVDPYTYIVYYFGDKLIDKYFSAGDGQEDDVDWRTKETMYMFCFNTNIGNFEECLRYMAKTGKVRFTKKEKAQLSDFGLDPYAKDDNSKMGKSNLPDLLDPIELTGTQYEGRIERIEKVKVGDKVILVREPDNPYDSNAIDVRNANGSLGHINAEACAIIAPLMDDGDVDISASISSVTPLSKRSKRCKTALVSIYIEFS